MSRALSASVIVDGSELMALRVALEERVSDLAKAEVLVGAPDEHAFARKPLEAVGKNALVRVFDANGDEKRFAGIVMQAGVRRAGALANEVSLLIRPRLAKLELRTDCRTYQNLSVVEVVTKVLEGAGYAGKEIKDEVGDKPPPRAAFVQYRETDWEFIARILSETGLMLITTTDGDVDLVTLTDKDLGLLSPDTIDALEGDGLTGEKEAVFRLRRSRAIAPGKVTTLVHDFERPKLDPTKVSETGSDAEKALEVFNYPVRSVDDAEVERAARVAAEGLAARRSRITGETSSLRLAPGHRVTLQGHPYAALNGELLLLATNLVWSRNEHNGVRGAFEAWPMKEPTPYRPVVREARAPARGLVSARVTGASGKEVDPDQHGRVTVLPSWDRVGKSDHTSSPKVRATQLPLGESMFTPRVGWEVLVGHWDGDADDALIVGRMIHGAAPPIYGLPAGKSKLSLQTPTTPSGGSSNEIRFDDAANAEEMFFNASKDMSQKVGNNATTNVTANATRDVGANRTFAVTSSYEETISGSRSISVGGSQVIGITTYVVDDVASHSHTVGGSRNITIGGDHKNTATGACTIDVGGTCIDLVAGTVSIENAAAFTDETGAVRVDLCAGNRAIEISSSYSETIGAAKVILAAGSVVGQAASLTRNTSGAILIKTSADHVEQSSGGFTEVAAGAHIIKATNVVIEASSLLSIVMGASTITLTPASVSIAGTNIKIDAASDQLGIVLDN